LAENEQLRDSHLESLKHSSFKGTRDDVSQRDMHPFAPVNAEVMSEMNERLDIMMSENALLLEQKTLLRTELEQHQEELIKRTSELQELSSKLKIYAKEIQNLRGQVADLEHDRNELGAKLIKRSEVIAQVEAEKEELAEQHAQMQRKTGSSELAISDLKKQLKALLTKSEEESYAYMKRTKVAEDRVRDLHLQLLKKNQELEESQDTLRKLRREYQGTRQDAEGMLQVMSGLERQLSDYSAREADLDRRMKENKELLETALVAKDQAVAREEHCRREIDRLTAERKRASSERQREIDSAVELATAKAETHIKTLSREMESLVIKASQMQLDTEFSTKEYKQDKVTIEKLTKLLDEDRKSSFVIVKSLEEKLVAVTVAREEEQRRCHDVQEQNKELRIEIDRLRDQSDSSNSQSENREKSRDFELSTLRLEHAKIAKELAETNRLLARKQSEFQELKNESDEKVAALDRKHTEDVEQSRRLVTDLKAALRVAEQLHSSEVQNSVAALDQVKERNVAALKYLENRLLEERENVSVFHEKNE